MPCSPAPHALVPWRSQGGGARPPPPPPSAHAPPPPPSTAVDALPCARRPQSMAPAIPRPPRPPCARRAHGHTDGTHLKSSALASSSTVTRPNTRQYAVKRASTGVAIANTWPRPRPLTTSTCRRGERRCVCLQHLLWRCRARHVRATSAVCHVDVRGPACTAGGGRGGGGGAWAPPGLRTHRPRARRRAMPRCCACTVRGCSSTPHAPLCDITSGGWFFTGLCCSSPFPLAFLGGACALLLLPHPSVPPHKDFAAPHGVDRPARGGLVTDLLPPPVAGTPPPRRAGCSPPTLWRGGGGWFPMARSASAAFGGCCRACSARPPPCVPHCVLLGLFPPPMPLRVSGTGLRGGWGAQRTPHVRCWTPPSRRGDSISRGWTVEGPLGGARAWAAMSDRREATGAWGVPLRCRARPVLPPDGPRPLCSL